MKVIIVNTVYKYGSTGKLTCSLGNYLKQQGHDVTVCFGVGNGNDDLSIKIQTELERWIHAFFSRLTGLQGFFSFFSTNKLLKYMHNFSPDIVFLGNLHGNYINIYDLYDYLNKKKIPTVQIMWDEFSFTGKCAFTYDCNKFQEICEECPMRHNYPKSWLFDTANFLQSRKKKAYINPFLAFVGVPYTAKKAESSYLLHDKLIFSLDEGIDVEKIFYPRDTEQIRNEMGIPLENKVILNVCPYPDKRKGGEFYLELARNFEDVEGITFIHVGFCGNVAECPPNFIPIGYIYDQDKLAEYYSIADLFVCTSCAETQPDTCLEALSCGTPICGFDISGIPTCADYPFGQYVDFGDVDSLGRIVKEVERKSKGRNIAVREYAVSRFSSKEYNRKLMEIGCNMINLKLKSEC